MLIARVFKRRISAIYVLHSIYADAEMKQVRFVGDFDIAQIIEANFEGPKLSSSKQVSQWSLNDTSNLILSKNSESVL